jgi:hypothetical protein
MVVTYGHNSQVWKKKFTEPGEPGNMAAQLQMQGRMVGTGMVSDPQSSSILRKLGVNSEVTRLPHRVLWTEAFFGVKKIAMHHASRSAKPPFAFVQHFSTCCNSFSPPILSPSSATAFCMAPIERCYKTSDDSCILPSLPQKVPHIFRGVGSG